MDRQIKKHCKVCGAEYEMCYSCEKKHSWKMHTDTKEHFYIFGILMEYQVDHNARQAYNALRKRGIDFRNMAEFNSHTREVLAEIYALAHEKSRAKKAATKAEFVNSKDTASGEAVE